jgi:ribosomal protein S18 acetylase RimI-like enzyme
MSHRIVPATNADAEALRAFVTAAWGAETVVARKEKIRPVDHAGFVALDADRVVGHAAYRVDGRICELIAIVAEPRRRGIGGALLDAVLDAARDEGCSSVSLTTTNDNLEALRFYQRRGFRLTQLRTGAVDEARRLLKAEIPTVGQEGIPMHDEIDLALEI